ncbi:hypothetical protein GOBAR_AA37648 [Gossypium barbadense]|uniref:Uncharacterized protein n=2 Tax=Gossypium TaxID=3633 RepID=A0A2P5VW48_GOSBA|nr:hypothetical protein GOBAR_AA37648 [Gossypium barbadense]
MKLACFVDVEIIQSESSTTQILTSTIETGSVHAPYDEALVLKNKSLEVEPYLNGHSIYLVGLMGSGKTTVGKILSNVLSYSFCDSDALIEQEVNGMSVAEIFKLHGERFFRKKEVSQQTLSLFITAVDYFSYLYPEASVHRVFAVVYMVVGLACLLVIVFYAHKSKAYMRINVGLGIFVVSLLVVPVMDAVYIKGQVGLYDKFYVTVGLLALAGIGDALVQGGLIGVAGELPERYMQAIVAGSGGSGLTPFLVEKHSFSPELAVKTASSLTYVKDPRKCDTIISFLKESGFSKSHIEAVVKRKPNLLYSSLEKTIKPKFKIFQDLGFSTHDVADIVASDPWILTRSVDDRIAPSISDLKTVLGSNDDVVKLLKTSAWFLKSDLQKTMMPNIEFLRNCGICSSQIVSYVFSFPRFFLLKPESIKQFVERADALGFDRKSNMFLAAIRMLSSMSEENWELKLKLFRKLGFSEDDIMSTFRRTPQVFAVSERKIKQVTDFLLNRTNVGISFIISHPMVLICSLERRLKPRLLVIETLESKNSLRRKVSMTTIYKMPDKKFREKYVVPYLKELEEVSMSIVGT